MVREGSAVVEIERNDGQWRLRCGDGTTYTAPIVVNTAGRGVHASRAPWARTSRLVSAR